MTEEENKMVQDIVEVKTESQAVVTTEQKPEEPKENPNTMIALKKTTAQKLLGRKQLGETYDDVVNRLLKVVEDGENRC